ncbi:MAG: adenylate/guanylate cyclase domain-containing protein [Alphaproteobacteria bacterium]
MAEIGLQHVVSGMRAVPDEAPAAPFRSWSRSRIASWLADHDGVASSAGALVEGLCALLQEHGVPLWRVSLALRDSHPQIAARGIAWYRGRGIEEQDFLVNDANGEIYDASPVKVIHDGAAAVRRRLCDEGCPMDFPVLHELRAEGATDYLAMALPFSDGSRHFISWTTDREGGFTSEQLEHLVDLMPLIGLRLELDHARLTTRTLLTTYLGPEAAGRVAKGTIRRFDYEMINAVILFSDLRGFTEMADTLPPSTVVRVLSDYYETVAEPVRYFGGDIIKMIGDGVLAIFPLSADAPRERIDRTACGAAAAVRRAMTALDAVLIEDLPARMRTLRAGFALHAGEVFFGNIGSTDRLDFTVVGPAVNEAVRAEALCKELGVSVITTQAFAGLECTVGLRSLGRHCLRGVREPKELFTLDG